MSIPEYPLRRRSAEYRQSTARRMRVIFLTLILLGSVFGANIFISKTQEDYYQKWAGSLCRLEPCRVLDNCLVIVNRGEIWRVPGWGSRVEEIPGKKGQGLWLYNPLVVKGIDDREYFFGSTHGDTRGVPTFIPLPNSAMTEDGNCDSQATAVIEEIDDRGVLEGDIFSPDGERKRRGGFARFDWKKDFSR